MREVWLMITTCRNKSRIEAQIAAGFKAGPHEKESSLMLLAVMMRTRRVLSQTNHLEIASMMINPNL
jgi:hypothetical protein